MRPHSCPVTSRRGLAEPGKLRRLSLLPIIAATLAPIAACTTTGSATTQSRTGSPAPAATRVATSPSAQPARLTCADAYTTEPQGPEPPAFSDSGVGFESLSKTGFVPIPAQNALPWNAAGYFSKSPIHLDNHVSWAELTVINGEVTFAWVPAAVWTGTPRGPSRTYEAKTAHFESCDGAYTGFLGGILTPTSRGCITLGIRSNLHPEVEPFQVAIGKGSCG